ncbi:calpain-14 isoform X1 [Strigops habroptila]|uniref:calpain-14 isoform X1 n=1 Tax=Strigops habroptila TaxID=2489341 RepID=UPI0011D01189|nr:calpain-14 isoform X1 [Strigops habroptila]XP_030354827.1 calpain-14 isoform X1 [Strigops habroptila]
MPFLLCLKRKKSPGPLGRSIFQKHPPLAQQNYQALLDMCLKSNRLFTDDTFPAHISSIGTGALLKKLPRNLQWKRPHALHRSPVFYAANRKQLDLCQGLVENCWFLAALQALTFHQDIFAAVVPQNQSFERKYAGIFHFRFWHFGEWVDVVVDDRLPVNEAGELIFVSSVYKNVFWGALLEKAYAKLYGSYEDLQIGQVSEALVDFTGGVNIRIKLAAAPPDLWDILTRATYSRSLMGCQTHLGTTKVLKNGLVAGHAYTVTGIRKVTCQYGPENLVRLRNPWGKIEWKGDWSDSSYKWELLSPKEKILLRKKKEDGEFWMSLQDFKIHFVDLMICKLTPDLMSKEDGKKWMYSLKRGRWVKGSTAGGSLGFCNGTFWMNPQYWLNVLPVEDSKKSLGSCNVVISLMQKHSSKHRNRAPHLFIGFSLYKVDLQYQESNRKLLPAFFTQHQPVNKHQVFLDEREVTHDFQLEPCVYVIVPSTLEPQQEAEFILRVFSRKHVLREMGGNTSFTLSKEIVDRYEGKIWEDFFTKYFEQNPEINAVQLQRILNNVSWRNFQSFHLSFSLDACQGILALLDLNTSGTLSIQEFRVLWKRLLFYLEVFQKRNTSRSGKLDLVELHAAVQETGISLSNEVCNLMAIRYGDPHLKISFESFVCFMLRVEIMGEAFRNLTQDGRGIYLQESEVLKKICLQPQKWQKSCRNSSFSLSNCSSR